MTFLLVGFFVYVVLALIAVRSLCPDCNSACNC